jgi:C4-dicarboxylate transporter DctM subunit
MSDITTVFLLLGIIIAMLASGVWVAFALLLTGFLSMVLLSSAPIGPILATTMWGHSHSWALAALPMFI